MLQKMDGEMLPLRSGILAKAIKHCIQLSTTNAIYISHFLIAMSAFQKHCPEVFCKKGVLKNFARFTGVSSGTEISCKFCDILKNAFFLRTPPTKVINL